MAALQKKGDHWYCTVRYLGKRHTFTIGQVTDDEAQAKNGQVDLILMRLKQNLLTVPEGMTITEFLIHDGKPPAKKAAELALLSLSTLGDKYIKTHEASLEANTLECIRIHFRHFTKHFGELFCVSNLTLEDLQGYVDKRSATKTAKGKISPVTIRKEITY